MKKFQATDNFSSNTSNSNPTNLRAGYTWWPFAWYRGGEL